eukprot:UN05468
MRYHEAYYKVNNLDQEGTEDENEEDYTLESEETKYNPCCRCLYFYVESQTRLSSLILYAYLFWFFFVMFAFGFRHMTARSWVTASSLAGFICIVLSAATYYTPACGPNGHFKIFMIFTFWIIPFSVSSVYIACNAAHNECRLLLPTDGVLFVINISGIIAILFIGSVMHYFCAPICKVYTRFEMEINGIKSSDDSTSSENQISPLSSEIKQWIDPFV